jgi:hypothetical protein
MVLTKSELKTEAGLCNLALWNHVISKCVSSRSGEGNRFHKISAQNTKTKFT